MTEDEIFREYVKHSYELLPVLLRERKPTEVPLDLGPNTLLRVLIEVQAASLVHVLKKIEAEKEFDLRKILEQDPEEKQ